jgi:predicted transposase YbfD/YdcC
MSQTKLSILDHFADLQDPRRDHCKLHLLQDIVAIALCAVIAGANTWQQIETFGKAKKDWLAGFLALPNGVPSHDTFRRVFCLLNPRAFEDCFVSWMNAACDTCGLQRIHIDGKTLRGSRRKAPGGLCPALHLVSAWAGANHLTLGQVAVEGKSNEITAIPKVLDLFDLKGCLVSIDAIGCQKGIAQKIVGQGGDYLLQVKENQPTLLADIQACFDRAAEAEFEGVKSDGCDTRENKGHGREEERAYTVIYDPQGLSTRQEWQGLEAIMQVYRRRCVGGNQSEEWHYYISSSGARAKVLAESARGHWSIENNLHWVLDVVFKEDACRTRDENAASNLALLRKIALSLLKRAPGKESMLDKRLHAAWDDTYLETILSSLLVKQGQSQPPPPLDRTPHSHAPGP